MQQCQLELMSVRLVWSRRCLAAMQSAERLKLLGSFVFLPACRGIFFFDPSSCVAKSTAPMDRSVAISPCPCCSIKSNGNKPLLWCPACPEWHSPSWVPCSSPTNNQHHQSVSLPAAASALLLLLLLASGSDGIVVVVTGQRRYTPPKRTPPPGHGPWPPPPAAAASPSGPEHSKERNKAKDRSHSSATYQTETIDAHAQIDRSIDRCYELYRSRSS